MEDNLLEGRSRPQCGQSALALRLVRDRLETQWARTAPPALSSAHHPDFAGYSEIMRKGTKKYREQFLTGHSLSLGLCKSLGLDSCADTAGHATSPRPECKQIRSLQSPGVLGVLHSSSASRVFMASIW